MGEMAKSRRRRWGLAAAALIFILGMAGLYGYCVYRGYVQLNHPSRQRYPVRGVDVSRYQGDIDWKILGEQDVAFAYIKATEGSSHVDSRFAANWEGARAAGVKAGAYHFFSFDSPAEGQLDHFVSTVPAYPEMLPPTVDFEFYGDKKANPPEVESTAEQLTVMLEGLEAHYGVKPVIYATKEAWELYLKGRFDRYPLWIRSVVTRPDTGDTPWTFWQYSNRGRLKGYTEEEFIDLNVFGGSAGEWEAWSGQYARAAAHREEGTK